MKTRSLESILSKPDGERVEVLVGLTGDENTNSQEVKNLLGKNCIEKEIGFGIYKVSVTVEDLHEFIESDPKTIEFVENPGGGSIDGNI